VARIERHRVVVVGLGAWGSHILWQLAERGVDVLGVDSHRPPHALGSSGGATRMFRTACLEHPDLVPMARRSAELWDELSRHAGHPVLDRGGALLLGHPEGSIVGGSLRAAAEHDLPIEVMEPADVRRRFPGHASLPNHHLGVLEAGGGLTDAPGVIRAALARAEALGARLATGVRVTALAERSSGLDVITPLGHIEAEHVVVAAGGWTGGLVPEVDRVQQNVRFPMTWLHADDRPELAIDAFPVFMRQHDDGSVLWGHGIRPGDRRDRLKIGIEDHEASEAFDVAPADDIDRTVGQRDWKQVASRAVEWVPGVRAELAEASIAQFARTPDGQFLLGSIDTERRLVVATGCNAHGFKHSAAIGEVVADIVQGTAPRVPIGAFAPLRFAAT
jgi:sarcosine oxidase